MQYYLLFSLAIKSKKFKLCRTFLAHCTFSTLDVHIAILRDNLTGWFYEFCIDLLILNPTILIPFLYFLLHRWKMLISAHCTSTAIPFIYSFSGNSAASAPISTFMCLWAIYIFPGSVYIFPPAEQADPSWEYIIHLQTHECGNWDGGPDIPFLGIFVSNFRHFVFAVCMLTSFWLTWDTGKSRPTWSCRLRFFHGHVMISMFAFLLKIST